MKNIIKINTHEEMEAYLFNKYPIIFGDRTKDMSETCMCWGLDHDIGWFNIIDNLCERVQLIADTTGIQLVANQVKEQYGGLRFSFHTINTPILSSEDILTEEQYRIWYDIIDELVSAAENKSEYTCEVCGEHGKLCGTSWLRTLCKTCAEKLKYIYPKA